MFICFFFILFCFDLLFTFFAQQNSNQHNTQIKANVQQRTNKQTNIKNGKKSKQTKCTRDTRKKSNFSARNTIATKTLKN